MTTFIFLHSLSLFCCCCFCSSDWVIFDVLSSRLLILSSAWLSILLKLSIESFSWVNVFFHSRVSVLFCFVFDGCYYFIKLVLLMHWFPNFLQLSVFSCSWLNFLKRIVLSSYLIHRSPFFRVSYYSFIGFLWWYHIDLIFYYPWFLMLLRTYLNNAAHILDCTGLLWQRQFSTSQPS